MGTDNKRHFRDLINEYRRNLKGIIDSGLDVNEQIGIIKTAKAFHDDNDERLFSAVDMAYDLGFMVAWKMKTGPVGSEAAALPQDGPGSGCMDGPGSGADQIYSKLHCAMDNAKTETKPKLGDLKHGNNYKNAETKRERNHF